jgi:hypothetical protein
MLINISSIVYFEHYLAYYIRELITPNGLKVERVNHPKINNIESSNIATNVIGLTNRLYNSISKALDAKSFFVRPTLVVLVIAFFLLKKKAAS